jgi:hypothetical protein
MIHKRKNGFCCGEAVRKLDPEFIETNYFYAVEIENRILPLAPDFRRSVFYLFAFRSKNFEIFRISSRDVIVIVKPLLSHYSKFPWLRFPYLNIFANAKAKRCSIGIRKRDMR